MNFSPARSKFQVKVSGVWIIAAGDEKPKSGAWFCYEREDLKVITLNSNAPVSELVEVSLAGDTVVVHQHLSGRQSDRGFRTCTIECLGSVRQTCLMSVWLVLLLCSLVGCRSRTLNTVMRGAMNMDGAMRVDGDMQMSGEIASTMKTDNTASRLVSVPVYRSESAGMATAGKIAVVDVDGILLNKNFSGFGSFGENPVALFREKLDFLATDGEVRAIVLRINSPGGGVTATDIMTRDLLQLKQQLQVPIVACLMDVGAGGGYYLASSADAIVAHPTSLVGGIGVIFNAYNLEDALGQFGVVSLAVKSGDRIDAASPMRMMEESDREMLQSIADSFHQRFIMRVRTVRTKIAGEAETSELFDGRVFTGDQAAENGLIDQVGYLDDAVVLARNLAGLNESATVSMLRRTNDRAFTLLDVTPNTPTTNSIIPLNVPGLDRSSLPTFMYLWQPEPSVITAAGP